MRGYRYGFNGKENDNEVKGEGNQQDYGMRVYDPRIGRFLSVDPLSAGYPHYSPYQFGGNNPIRNLDLDGMEEWDYIQRFINYTQDMRNTPMTYRGVSGRVVKTTLTLHSSKRNFLAFWENNIQEHPNFLNAWNQDRVLIEGRAPIITRGQILHWESNGENTAGLKIGDILEHHHIAQGDIGVPISSSDHDLIQHQKKVTNAELRRLGLLSTFLDFGFEALALFSKNPDKLINQFGSQSEVGVVYKNINSNFYFTITNSVISGNTATASFDIYRTYGYDEEAQKYVGVDKIGYGISVQQKGGVSSTTVYDNDGNFQSSTSTGEKKDFGAL